MYFLTNTVKISPVIIPFVSNTNASMVYTFDTVRQVHFARRSIDKPKGFSLCSTSNSVTSSGMNIFSCQTQKAISAHFLCDEQYDCRDMADEVSCTCHGIINSQFCKIFDSSKEVLMCGPLFWKNKTGFCTKFETLPIVSKTSYLITQTHVENVTCSDGVQIAKDLMNDLASDCSSGDDEEILKHQMKTQMGKQCDDKSTLPCKLGHPKCFEFVDLCVFKLNKFGHLTPCRNGGHLESCGIFECNMMFKCPHHYCIPWEYVCDGKWDCPLGTEESDSCQPSHVCIGMFKCHGNMNICLHVGNLCDGESNCPGGNDEFLCELQGLKCPRDCSCLAFALWCHNPESVLVLNNVSYPFVSVHFQKTKLKFLKIFHSFESLLICKIIDVGLNTICNVVKSIFLQTLVAKLNPIKTVERLCFQSQPQLESLQLTDNEIEKIQSFAFANLSHLMSVNLSNNALRTLPVDTFGDTAFIEMFSICGNSLDRIESNTFSKLQFSIIETENYKVCCLVSSNATCNAVRPWYVNCFDLLPNSALKTCFSSVALLILLLNLLSIRSLSAQGKMNLHFIGLAVSVSLVDFVNGLFLLIISAADLLFRGSFIIKEWDWRSSPTCFSAAGLVLGFNLLSPAFICLLSFGRLLVVINPVKTRLKETRFNLRVSLGLLFTGIIGTTFPVLHLKLASGALPTNFCLPFVEPMGSKPITKFVTCSVSLIQIFCSVVIIESHVLLLKALEESRKVRHEPK